MASTLPAKLKSADIARFAHRAAQLESVKPAIAYWCEYYVVNQIISKGLHSADADCLQYTTALMEKLEQTKNNHDIATDDESGQVEVRAFGQQTLERADRAVQADKVTRQTADTFQAAATFLELLRVWGEPDAEAQSQIKYAKWNAVRIAKAIKEGKDPNESNPKLKEEDDGPPLDPNDPDVQQIMGEEHQPTVEEVPDDEDQVEARLAATSYTDQSLHPSEQPSARPSPPASHDPSPLAKEVSDAPADARDRTGSVGGGYFPEVPTFTAESHDPTFTTAPSDAFPDPDPMAATSPMDAEYYAPPAVPPPTRFPVSQPSAPPAPPLANPAPSMPIPIASPRDRLVTDDAAITKAQKHAKWAISALNFEDVETAVKELRNALQTLGAR